MKQIVSIFLLSIALFSCSDKKKTITIAAAADLQYALDDIKAAFVKDNPNITVNVIYGSSGNLYQQIVNKAPFDIFFSADILYPRKLDSINLAATTPKLYGTGFLALWTTTLDTAKGLALLTDSEVRKIAIANPKHAPYGKRAIEFLKYHNLYDAVKDKLVEGENISQTAQFVLTGNAEIGIVALSLALSPTMQQAGKFIAIEEKSHSPLEQAYIIVKGSETKTEVRQFYDFVETPAVRAIFTKYGFSLPNNQGNG